jgi:holo-[acyl-carrier protein] synthase
VVPVGQRILVAAVAVISVGLDVVEMPRARSLFERHAARILTRTLTADESRYVMSLGDPVPAFAARLAAKEAVYKALQVLPGARPVGWREIEVRRLPDGRPVVELHGRAADLLAPHRVTVHLSLSHSRDVAAAVAILEG